ncbi:MAG: nucleotidyltransferase [Candidatus Electrothrix sp. AUS4]|nr:nucleotidyltransferase [Candidatus Electrothrix sp. AUS4]
MKLNSSEYLRKIIVKNSLTDDERNELRSKIRPLQREVRLWAGEYLAGIRPSGSFEKGTAVKDSVDIDLLISIKRTHPDTLKEIYHSLYEILKLDYEPRKQNVSIGLVYNGVKVDLVPARIMSDEIYNHSIYVRKLDSWKKTNIHNHIKVIKESRHKCIVKLLKVWRNQHGIEFPSFLIELVVLNALKGKRIRQIDERLICIFRYLQEDFINQKIVDPANVNNVVSDTISRSEKSLICRAAESALNADYWEEVVWGLYSKKRL